MQGGRVTFMTVLAVREFRALWAAEALSQAGDQLARVALSVLVFERTSSAGWTGLVYGLTYLPTLVGGTLLSGLADRYPRRTVMVVCDLLRAVVAAVMAVPGTDLGELCALLVVLTVAGGPFRAAQQAMLPDILAGEQYVTGLAVRNMTIQSAQLAGFAGGGFVIALTGPYWGMALDAVTFVLSAALVWLGVRSRAPKARNRFPLSPGAGFRALRQAPGLPVLFWLKMLAGLYVLPEGLAAPYADDIGSGTFAVGLILASDPVGSVVGAWIYSRWVPDEVRPRLPGLLAVGAGIPLVFLAFGWPLPVDIALIALSGMLAAPYHMQATALITRGVPDEVRAQVSGLSSTALVTVQGLGIVVAGGVAQVVGVRATLGGAALLGTLLATAGALAWQRTIARQPGKNR